MCFVVSIVDLILVIMDCCKSMNKIISNKLGEDLPLCFYVPWSFLLELLPDGMVHCSAGIWHGAYLLFGFMCGNMI